MANSGLRVRVLGPVCVGSAEAGPVEVTGANARALVAALALAGGSSRSAVALADDIWGDEPPQNPRAALQTVVSRLRASAGSDIVRSDPAGYALGVAAEEVDLGRAQRLTSAVAALDRSDPQRIDLADEALALWNGEPSADLADAPVSTELADAAGTLRDELETARADTLLAVGRVAEAATALRALTASRPYDEILHAQLMRALAATGRTQDAVAVFAELRRRLRDDLGTSPGATLADLHTRLLRDTEAAPAPRVRIGLRAEPNELIGRADDIAAIGRLLGRSRLVTVLGAGGLGKTRLAQAVAAASTVPAVVFVPLASVRSDDDVPLAIASVLGISEAAPAARLAETRSWPDLRARVTAVLSERETLLILDNCEQVIDGAASWTADMLDAVPALRVLATSRTPFAVATESVYPLAALDSGTPAAPAVRLFQQRALAVRPNAVLPPDVVGRLCTHLDGLPLAIELAAARVRTMTPEQIEVRLRDRFALLTTGDRTAPERHRTLQAVIEWSWDLLDAEARRALACLSVLPAGFSASTAAAVLDEASVDDVLDRLVSQSLLLVADDAFTGGVRFRMLETVREFGISRLEDGEDAAWSAIYRWARGFCAARAGRVFDAPVYREVRAEHDNLVAVLRRAIDRGDDAETVLVFAVLSQAWFVRGAVSEFMSFGEPAFAAAIRVAPDAVSVEALTVVQLLGAFMLQFSEDRRHTARVIARLRIMQRRTPNLNATLTALIDVVGASTSADRIRSTIDSVRSSDDPARALVGQILMAQWAENEGDPVTAMAAAERAWELADDAGNEWLTATAAATAAQLASQSARPAEALEWLDRAETGFALLDAQEQLRQQVWLRAGSLLGLGRTREARALFEELTTSRELTQDGLELASIGWFGVAETDRAEGDTAAAAEHLLRAMDHFATHDQRASPWYLMAMAGLVSATTFDASLPPAEIQRWARRLRTRAVATRRARPEYVDKPVLGIVLVGWSAWALTVDGLREAGLDALALGEVLGSRQDLPSLRVATHRVHATAIMGADALERASAAASGLTVTEQVERALSLLTRR